MNFSNIFSFINQVKLKENVFNFKTHKKFDIIISYDALTDEGIFITSLLAPFPNISAESSWKNFNIKDLQLQIALLAIL